MAKQLVYNFICEEIILEVFTFLNRNKYFSQIITFLSGDLLFILDFSYKIRIKMLLIAQKKVN